MVTPSFYGAYSMDPNGLDGTGEPDVRRFGEVLAGTQSRLASICKIRALSD